MKLLQSFLPTTCLFLIFNFLLVCLPHSTSGFIITNNDNRGHFGGAVAKTKSGSTTTTTALSSSSYTKSEDPKIEAAKLKHNLIATLGELQRLQKKFGDFSNIDWGTKGGELTETGRVPKTVDYSMISPEVGEAATKIIRICSELADVTPISYPTEFLGDKQNGTNAPLNGAWKLLFTNAADAVFSKDSKRGAAKTQNVVNASKSRITNVIDFDDGSTEAEAEDDDAAKPPPVLKQLNVIIKATAVNKTRVQLDFRYAKVVLTKFLFLPRLPFGPKTFAFYIPVPATFVTQCIEFVKTCKKIFRKMLLRKPIESKGSKAEGEEEEKRSARGYFDILYLDDQLRIHKTGQGNLFVQTKENSWEAAIPLIR